MRALLGSGGIRTDERCTVYVEETRRHFGDVREILFIPWALHDHDAYLAAMRARGLDAGYTLVGIHQFDDPIAAIDDAQAISVGGGNTFRLTFHLHRTGAMDAIRRRVIENDVPYMGVSAGTNVACPTMCTTNDMPIVMPASLDTLGLVPFQINAHYFGGSTWVRMDDGSFIEHFGETRDDRIREYHEMNDRSVIGLREGTYLRCESGAVELVGQSARILRRGQEPVDAAPGTDLSALLS